MLDNEPTGTDSGADTESSSTPAPRRRRAASRPAGAAPVAPPVVEDAAPADAEPKPKRTRKKAAAAAPAADVVTADAPAADADADAKPKRTRKKAAAPAKKAAATPELSAADDAAEAKAPAPRSRKKAAAPAVPVLFQAPDPDEAVVKPKRTRKKAAAAPQSTDDAVVADELTEADAESASGDAPSADDEDGAGGPRRRRRRGGRGRRGRGGSDNDGSASTDDEEGASAEDGEGSEARTDDDESETSGGSRRRRRRRRTGDDGDTSDDPPNTVVKVREPRAKADRPDRDQPTGVKGSIRVEAKRQRRREGREAGRRRAPILTEAEFLARREAVERVMVVRQRDELTQIAVLEDGVLVEHHVSRETSGSLIGNVYLGRVQNVLPSMEAAFVDIGRGRNAVLYAGEVNWDAAGLEGQPKRIEFALKSGDAVLVQVSKDPVGAKGARLTSQVSLPGRYLVYVPDGSMTGISRKLPDTERSRLKSTLKRIVPENAGVIVRTASEGASEEELTRDVTRLAAQWEAIQKQIKTAAPPTLLYGEPELTLRVIRDIFNEDFKKLIVSGQDAWDTVDAYVGHVAPDLHDRLERWTSETDVWTEFRVEEQLAKALDRKVYLPSGGSLVIDRTEAMTVVDVNTGRFIGQGGNLEETVTKNNVEAAEEIVRQLRLRDIGGIIVVDFIDMVLESNRDLVLRRLLECLSRDRTKHQVAEVTSLGLVQMTRKRVGSGLIESFSTTCESCNGRGIHVHMEPVEPKKSESSGGGRSDKGGNKSEGKQEGKSGKGKSRNRKSKEQRSEGESASDTASETAPEAAGADAPVDSTPTEAPAEVGVSSPAVDAVTPEPAVVFAPRGSVPAETS